MKNMMSAEIKTPNHVCDDKCYKNKGWKHKLQEEKSSGGKSETTLQFPHEFVRTVKKLGFHGEDRTPCTLIIWRTHSSSHMSFSAFFAKIFFAQSFLLSCQDLGRIQFHRWVNCAELLITIPRKCNKLPLSLERWGCASHGSEVLLGFGTTAAHKQLLGLRLINIS